MESLRELESVKLRSRKEKEDTYLWESLQQTLGFLYRGEPHCLKLPAVKVSLTDPESTPLLNSVKLRNEAVQKVIRLLSRDSPKEYRADFLCQAGDRSTWRRVRNLDFLHRYCMQRRHD